MYSLLPAIVSALFLGYGLYAIAEKGFNRVTTGFFILCITTFFWQATWAVLFQVRDPQVADILIRFGYLLILFLPTSLYQFLVEISERREERRFVFLSYGIAACIAVFDVTSDLFVSGHYDYFFGFYPKAGPLHPLHVLQTVILGIRSLYITYRQQQVAETDKRVRLRLCIASLLAYFFAAVDYLCNYGVEFYPPGVVFVAISLGMIAVAVTKYDLLSPVAVVATMAATVAHEMRTPLANIRLQADTLDQFLPELHKGYQLAVDHGLFEPTMHAGQAQRISDLPRRIRHQVDCANTVIHMMLASARMEQMDTSTFTHHSAAACVAEALDTYPFDRNEHDKVSVVVDGDFEFHGSRTLLVYVLFNLLKNSLYAIKVADKGEIRISVCAGSSSHTLTFTDTATGIPAATLPKIFDTFFTTKKAAGAGIGLAFCRRAIAAFGGQMRCESVEGQYATFTLVFPARLPASQARDGRNEHPPQETAPPA